MAKTVDIEKLAEQLRWQSVKDNAKRGFLRGLGLTGDFGDEGPMAYDMVFSDALYGVDRRRGVNFRATLGAVSAFGVSQQGIARLVENGGVAVCDFDLYGRGAARPYLNVVTAEVSPLYEQEAWGERLVKAFGSEINDRERRSIFEEHADYLRANDLAGFERLADQVRRQAKTKLTFAIPLVCPYGPYKATGDGQVAFIDLREKEGYKYDVSDLFILVSTFGKYFDMNSSYTYLTNEQRARLQASGSASVFRRISSEVHGSKQLYTAEERKGLEVLKQAFDNLDRRLFYFPSFLDKNALHHGDPIPLDPTLLSYWFFPFKPDINRLNKKVEIQGGQGFSAAKQIFDEAVALLAPNSPIGIRTLDGFMANFTTMPEDSDSLVNLGEARRRTFENKEGGFPFAVSIDLKRMKLYREGFGGKSGAVFSATQAFEEARKAFKGYRLRMDFPDLGQVKLFS